MAGNAGDTLNVENAPDWHSLPLGNGLRGDSAELAGQAYRPACCLLCTIKSVFHAAIESTAFSNAQAKLSMIERLAVSMVPTMESVADRIVALREAKGLTQEGLAAKLDVSRGAVGNWELGKNISRKSIEALAAVFDVSVDWLLHGGDRALVFPATEPTNATIVGKTSVTGAKIPLYGQAVGGIDGEFVLNGGDRLTDVLAPPALASVEGAYAVTCSGDSMEPRYFDGEIVYVNPKRRPTKGDFVVVQIHNPNDGSPPLAYIKRLVRYSEAGLVLEQFNPSKELRFEFRQVHKVHVIVGSGDRLLEQW